MRVLGTSSAFVSTALGIPWIFAIVLLSALYTLPIGTSIDSWAKLGTLIVTFTWLAHVILALWFPHAHTVIICDTFIAQGYNIYLCQATIIIYLILFWIVLGFWIVLTVISLRTLVCLIIISAILIIFWKIVIVIWEIIVDQGAVAI